MTRLAKILILIGAALVTVRCTYNETSDYANIDPDGWRYGDTLILDPAHILPKIQPIYTGYHNNDTTTTDTSHITTGDLSVVIRHTNNYEYSNIWLQIDYQGADTCHTDTVNVLLADDFGKWLGKGIGVSYQQSHTVLENIEIDPTKPIKLTHIMRVDTLENVEQVGVVFVPIQN